MRHKEGGVLRQSLGRLLSRRTRQALLSWAAAADDRGAKLRLLRIGLSGRAMHELRGGLMCWRLGAEAVRQHTLQVAALRRGALHMMHRQLCAALGRWTHVMRGVTRSKEALDRSLVHLLLRELSMAFASLRWAACERRESALLQRRALGRLADSEVCWAMGRWRVRSSSWSRVHVAGRRLLWRALSRAWTKWWHAACVRAEGVCVRADGGAPLPEARLQARAHRTTDDSEGRLRH